MYTNHLMRYSNYLIVLFINIILLYKSLIQANNNDKIESSFKSGWIDPDTPPEFRTTKSFVDGLIYDLVMSDEFETPGRTFADGDDPAWTALDKSDDDQTSNGKKSLQFYNSSNVYTENGRLIILTNTEDTKWKDFNPYKKKYQQMSRNFKSGMIQGWNKFCFTGGILEIDVIFPGNPEVGGLWPALWLLGNLGRGTYESSTNKMWPWSYSVCNKELQRAQEISACDVATHYSFNPKQGRGATEIDLIEVMPGKPGNLPIVQPDISRPYGTMTLQVAPGIPSSAHRPPSGTRPDMGFHWYPNLTYGANVSINPFFYGTYLGPTSSNEPAFRSIGEAYQADALSSMMTLDESFFKKMHTMRLEWMPGPPPKGVKLRDNLDYNNGFSKSNSDGKSKSQQNINDRGGLETPEESKERKKSDKTYPNGYTNFYVDNKFLFGVAGNALAEMATSIPNEPSYVIMNTAISTSWGFPNPPPGCDIYDCKVTGGQCGMDANFCSSLPAKMQVDHVRVYQLKNESRHSLGCNPPGWPTTKFIQAHQSRYMRQHKDLHPLKQQKVGGGRCLVDSDCGVHGQGATCSGKSCKCPNNMVGPHCKTFNYKNDFPDWDVDPFPALQMPTINVFLSACLLGLGVILGLTVIDISTRKDKSVSTWKWL